MILKHTKQIGTIIIKIYYRIIRYIIGISLRLFGLSDVGSAALDILRRVVFYEGKIITQRPIPIEKQVFFIFANRVLIDAQSARLLAQKGYYGSGYSIIAVMLRSIAMYASLVADKNRLNNFWSEEVNTYQTNPGFSNSFNETSIRNLAKDKFGKDTFDKSEIEKLLHGSCYAIRKYYSKRQINSEGKSEPLLMFGKFRQESKRVMIKSITEAIILDFLGIFFTEYQEDDGKDYDGLLSYYYNVIKRAQIETVQLEKEFAVQTEKLDSET